jgi:hypothetical protein
MLALANLTDEEALISGIAVFVRHRDLNKFPPQDNETLESLGISATSLDVPIRAWINARFRLPNGWVLFKSGDLKNSMKWSEFKAKVLAA